MSTQRSRLTDEVDRLDENVNGLFAQVSRQKDRIEELEEENSELRERLDEVERLAETALGVAESVDDGSRADGGPSKKRKAQLLSRNEVVRHALVESGKGGSVTVADVKDMALPETKLYQRSVEDAWETLVSEWGVFWINDREEPKRLKVDAADLVDYEDLVGVVERDLERDDLSERLHRRSD